MVDNTFLIYFNLPLVLETHANQHFRDFPESLFCLALRYLLLNLAFRLVRVAQNNLDFLVFLAYHFFPKI